MHLVPHTHMMTHSEIRAPFHIFAVKFSKFQKFKSSTIQSFNNLKMRNASKTQRFKNFEILKNSIIQKIKNPFTICR
jgi:hypothetical protein